MGKLTQITLEVTDEQFERLDRVGIFDQVGVLFQSCRIVIVNTKPPIAKDVIIPATKGANT